MAQSAKRRAQSEMFSWQEAAGSGQQEEDTRH